MAIFDVLKTAAKVAQEAGKIDLYGQILEVYEKLLEQQKQIVELEGVNKELREKLETKESLQYQNGAYWAVKEDASKDGPFCSRCWDVEKNTVRLKPCGNQAFHSCPECKSQFKTSPDYQPMFTSRRPPPSFI
ncbi:MAG: hypothetical protein EXS69_02050 [Candidatus Zambryskibacteria bacterium]|nr:hypothetical protein [Candidatus Zambryskibacteria bacterium]